MSPEYFILERDLEERESERWIEEEEEGFSKLEERKRAENARSKSFLRCIFNAFRNATRIVGSMHACMRVRIREGVVPSSNKV